MDALTGPEYRRLYELGYNAGAAGLPTFVGRGVYNYGPRKAAWMAGYSKGLSSRKQPPPKQRLNAVGLRSIGRQPS